MNKDILEINYHVVGYDKMSNVPHNDQCVEILQMWSTGGYFVVKNNIFPIEAGFVFLVNAIETHYSNPKNADNYKRSKIIVSADYFRNLIRLAGLESYADKFLFENGGYEFQINPSSQRAILIDQLFDSAEKIYTQVQVDDLAKSRLTINLLQILLLLFSIPEEGQRDAKSLDESPKSVIALCDYINKNLYSYENISLEKICGTLHLSASYISHLFKKVTNKSITQYMTELRISEAKKLLLNTDMKVFEISERLHFHNSTIFCKTFKKIVHCTPLEYRVSKGKHNN